MLGGPSRHSLTENNEKAIAAWELDLNQIFHVFNVRSIISPFTSLTIHLQMEIAVNTRLVVVDTQTMVSNIHRALVEHREESDGGNHLVRNYCILPTMI